MFIFNYVSTLLNGPQWITWWLIMAVLVIAAPFCICDVLFRTKSIREKLTNFITESRARRASRPPSPTTLGILEVTQACIEDYTEIPIAQPAILFSHTITIMVPHERHVEERAVRKSMLGLPN
jgi:hypothetical protein